MQWKNIYIHWLSVFTIKVHPNYPHPHFPLSTHPRMSVFHEYADSLGINATYTSPLTRDTTWPSPWMVGQFTRCSWLSISSQPARQSRSTSTSILLVLLAKDQTGVKASHFKNRDWTHLAKVLLFSVLEFSKNPLLNLHFHYSFPRLVCQNMVKVYHPSLLFTSYSIGIRPTS